MNARDGYVPEEYLGQILHEGTWLDYARGTKDKAFEWARGHEDRRVVDWIDKNRVLTEEG